MAASIQTPNLAQPDAGSMLIPLVLPFGGVTSINVDLTQEIELGKLDFIQSVYIDNADNASAIDLVFHGGPVDYRVRALGNQQGWFPVSWPKGATRLTANSNAGANITVMFANFAMPYYANAPTPGITIVPPLTNVPLDTFALVAGVPRQLVAGVAAKSVQLYRGLISVDAPCILKFQDGNGGATLFSAFLTVGGGLTFQASGVPWFATTAGNGLFVVSSANVNLYGAESYVQQ